MSFSRIARALCAANDLLILDEPVTGLDPASMQDLYKTLRYLNEREGMAIIIISDDLPEVLENCSRLLVLKAGRVVKELLPADTNEQEVLSYML